VLLGARTRQQNQLGGLEHQRKRAFFQVHRRCHQRESFEKLAHGFKHDLALEVAGGSGQSHKIGTTLRDHDACIPAPGWGFVEGLAQI